MIEIVDRRPAIRIDEPPEAPPTILYQWFLMPNGRIMAGRFEDHPCMGSGKNIVTSKIQYLDEVIGIARSKNTTYILRDKL